MKKGPYACLLDIAGDDLPYPVRRDKNQNESSSGWKRIETPHAGGWPEC
ncbi:hypothetical protein ACSMDF_01955 [Yersinia enterocolitica]|jgi:hypothetical protein|uniref:Uncharacterized protein n=1 Tax=Yersinia frederiksenii TaxID=29484 RepID=A0AAI9EQ56_YERFR|nr:MULTISPECIES: hypothetical protein [Yersinia]HEC1650687.1 hypothetical protein [Yersinia enterocolitica]MCB5316267.1 hypothetical protein [Yersinia massiliensis]MDN0129323.1 hypothetical protein [Yersinia massiliensis]CFR16057.1 Uncharacterised protein [Yersinia frederiksenii]CNL15109.1 Uncharacterised protein [Yersinia frederiksenii]